MKKINDTLISIVIFVSNKEDELILISCLNQLRKIYPNNKIIAVDNNSLVTEWINVSKELHIVVLTNNSNLYRYELGGYKLVLESYRANKYIFLAGTTYIKKQLDLSILDNIEPKVLPFMCWKGTSSGIILDEIAKQLLQLKLPLYNQNITPLLMSNMFCCNDACIEHMFKYNVFNLQITKKIQSGATERVLGSYFYHTKILHFNDNKNTDNIKCITDKRIYSPKKDFGSAGVYICLECEYFYKVSLGKGD